MTLADKFDLALEVQHLQWPIVQEKMSRDIPNMDNDKLQQLDNTLSYVMSCDENDLSGGGTDDIDATRYRMSHCEAVQALVALTLRKRHVARLGW